MLINYCTEISQSTKIPLLHGGISLAIGIQLEAEPLITRQDFVYLHVSIIPRICNVTICSYFDNCSLILNAKRSFNDC